LNIEGAAKLVKKEEGDMRVTIEKMVKGYPSANP
jgi:hypothetical protein